MARAGGHERSRSATDLNHPADLNFFLEKRRQVGIEQVESWSGRLGPILRSCSGQRPDPSTGIGSPQDCLCPVSVLRRRQADASPFTSLRIAPSRPLHRDWLVIKVCRPRLGCVCVKPRRSRRSGQWLSGAAK
jgi:hypothetical protein